MENLELLKELQKDILEKLNKMEYEDPNRKTLKEELNVVTDKILAYETLDQTRLNNNARNDIEEAKVAIEAEKVKNDRDRNKLTLFNILFTVGVGAYLHNRSYHMDEDFGYPFRELKESGTRLIDKAMSFIRK